MKICHISTVHTRKDIRIFHKEIKSLGESFNDIHFVIADGLGNEICDGVNIVDIGKPKNRIDRWFFFAKKAYSTVLKINPQIVHFHDPELIPLGKKCVKKNISVIYDVHEDVPRQLLNKPYFYSWFARLVSWVFEKYENTSVKQFDAVCCATPFITERFSRVHKNAVNINNFPLSDEIIDNEEEVPERQNKICYIGGITEIRGIAYMIDAMSICKNVSLELAGNFEDDAFRQKVELSAGWQYVNELGFVDRKKALEIKRTSLAGLVTFLPVENHINAQPNKLFEYMASGLPVISSDFPLWKEIVEGNDCGITVNPKSSMQIAEAVNFLLDNPERAKAMGENGRRTVLKKYNWQSEAVKLIELYRTINQAVS